MSQQALVGTPLDLDRARTAIESANVPILLMVLFHLTGDRRWLSDPFRPTPARGMDEHRSGGFDVETQTEVRQAALQALTAWAGGREAAVPAPTGALLGEMASWGLAEDIPPEYNAMMAAQMGFDGLGETPPGVDLDGAKECGYSVAIIGAGISGMFAALRLREAGIPHVILERSDGVGGVWRKNTYPGAGVDTPTHLYSYPFFWRDWSTYFARQPEVLEYLEDLADEYDIRPHVRFGTEVVAARYDEDEQCWRLTTEDASGRSELVVSAVISSVGLFKEPLIPDLPGLDDFEGPIFHSANWPAEIDLRGKRVAVVGSGASAMQIVPAIADEVERLEVFQRSPMWIAPIPHYFDQVTDDVQWLMNNVPYYRTWYRARLGWAFNDKVHPSMRIDPDWEQPDRSVNAINDRHRRAFTSYIESALAGRPDLIEKSVPSYPPYGKRILMDNGWYAALRKPNVVLIDEAVSAITPTGVRTAGGAAHDADTVVLCTGFHTNRYLDPIEVSGRDGVLLHDVWRGDDATAYLGVITKDFPNLFFMYGPGTNAGGGSFLSLAESWLNCIVGLLSELVRSGSGAVEPKPDVHDDYNRRMDEANQHMVWSHPGMSTYVRNSRGRVTVNMPWRIVDYWGMTERVDLDHFVFEPAGPSRRRTGLDSTWPDGPP